MEPGFLTLEEAARLTGLSPEALRKRWMRGKIRGQKSNDGKVRIWMDDQIAEALRESVRPGGQDDGQEGEESVAISALHRLVEGLERQIASQDEALRRERALVDEVREERARDRRAAMATIARLRREQAEIKSKLDEVLAGQRAAAETPPASAPRPGLLARLLGRR